MVKCWHQKRTFVVNLRYKRLQEGRASFETIEGLLTVFSFMTLQHKEINTLRVHDGEKVLNYFLWKSPLNECQAILESPFIGASCLLDERKVKYRPDGKCGKDHVSSYKPSSHLLIGRFSCVRPYKITRISHFK